MFVQSLLVRLNGSDVFGERLRMCLLDGDFLLIAVLILYQAVNCAAGKVLQVRNIRK